jgi:hypothetical protein
MDIVDFLLENLSVELLSFIGIMLYLFISKRRKAARGTAGRSSRVTSRSSDYYSTEIDELK